jgi:hypothetical protein
MLGENILNAISAQFTPTPLVNLSATSPISKSAMRPCTRSVHMIGAPTLRENIAYNTKVQEIVPPSLLCKNSPKTVHRCSCYQPKDQNLTHMGC